MYQWHFGIVWQYKSIFLAAAAFTILLTLSACIFGTLMGLGIALLGRSKNKWVTTAVRVYLDVFRAIPPFVWLIWMYYCIPILTGVKLSSFPTAVIALSICGSPFFAEIIRAGIEAIPKGQQEAAQMLGMNKKQTMIRIVLPQAIKHMLPPMVNEYITVLKLTSLTSIIAVPEIVYAANTIISNTYRPLETYTAIAILYIAIVIPLAYFAKKLEQNIEKKKKLFGGFNVHIG